MMTNSSWPAIIASLSKHNALKVTFETRISGHSIYTYSNTCNYNTQGFPTDGYLYSCKQKKRQAALMRGLKELSAIEQSMADCI